MESYNLYRSHMCLLNYNTKDLYQAKKPLDNINAKSSAIILVNEIQILKLANYRNAMIIVCHAITLKNVQ